MVCRISNESNNPVSLDTFDERYERQGAVRNRFVGRLRDWLNPAGVAGGAYLMAGATCPCCGSNACPVGMGSTVVVGGAAALIFRLWRFFRFVCGASAHPRCLGSEEPMREGEPRVLTDRIDISKPGLLE